MVLLVFCHAVPGGWNRLDPESEQVQDLTKKAVERFNMEVDNLFCFRLVHVTSALVKVTNALNYRITATIGETNCFKSEEVDLEKCEIGDKRMQCNFKVTYNWNSVEPKVMSSCG